VEFLLILLLIIWAVSPLGLIPAVIVLSVKNSRLKRLVSDGELPSESAVKPSKKERKPLSFTVILIIGVLFIIIAGILFATTTWAYTTGIVKTVLILSLSAVFFTASFLSDKKLGLDKTGFAFFILGGLFLPVSVMAVAFFELIGSEFSLTDSASAVPVMLVMFAVTLAVLAVSDFRYRGSAVSRYIFASAAAFELIGFTYAVTDAVYGYSADATVPALMLAGGYLLFMLMPALRTVPAQLAFVSALFYLSAEVEKGAVAAAVSALICVCVSVIVNRGVYSITSIIAAPVLTLNLIGLLTSDVLDEYGLRDYVYFYLWGMGTAAVISLIFGTVLLVKSSVRSDSSVPEHTGILTENVLIKMKWLERAFALAAGFMAFELIAENEAGIAGILAVFFYVLKAFMLHASGRSNDRNWALTLACLFTSFTLFLVEVPDIVEVEYCVLVSFAATVPLLFIWKNHRKIAEMVVFIHACAAFGIVMINAWDEEELINAVIPAGAGALMLALSFMRRAKKWFILSAAVLVVIVLQLTSVVWTSVSWWVYLLLTGIIFISYAAVNEYCRKKGQENPLKTGIVNLIDAVWKC